MASSYNSCTTVSLDTLNTDVLLEIFSYLDLLALKSIVCTCKVLKAVGYNPLLWRDTIVNIRRSVDITQSLAESFRDRKLRILILTDLDYCNNIQSYQTDEEYEPVLEVMSRCIEIAQMDTLFLADVHQPAIITTVMPHDFKHLRCLVLEKRWSYAEVEDGKIRELWVALKQLDSLEQFVIRFAITDKKQPHQKILSTMLNYVKLILDSLPRLKDLEVIRPYVYPPDSSRYPDIAYDSAFSVDETHIIPGLKRLSLKQSRIDDSLFRNPHRFPSLEHLSLSFKDPISSISMVPVCHMLERIPNLKSLQITTVNFSVLDLPMLYNLLALKINPVLSNSMIEKIRYLPQLQLLDLLTFYHAEPEHFTNWCIGLLCHLSNLKILIFTGLPNDYYSTPDHHRLQQCAMGIPGLNSLIGLNFSDELESLPSSIQYVTVRDKNVISDDEHSLMLLKRTCAGWRRVEEHSKTWHQAHGTHYFIPVSSYPDPSDIQRFQERHIDRKTS